MRLVLQAVGNRFDTFYDRLWLKDEPRQTRLVFISKNISLVSYCCKHSQVNY